MEFGRPRNLHLEARLQDNEQIVSQLHQAYSRRIYVCALRELRSHATAEDVSQETLVRVMEAIRGGKLVSPDALPGFASGTARNVIHEFRRKEGRAGPLGDLDFAAPEKTDAVDPAVRRAMEMVLQPQTAMRLRLNADMTLSACQTGLGKTAGP
jgi:DNA-directed RNA polymerase specialized sigma24 family protein